MTFEEGVSEESDSDTSSSSSSDSDSSESDEEQITQEYLDSLLERARKNAEDAEKLLQAAPEDIGKEEEVITLDDETQM